MNSNTRELNLNDKEEKTMEKKMNKPNELDQDQLENITGGKDSEGLYIDAEKQHIPEDLSIEDLNKTALGRIK